MMNFPGAIAQQYGQSPQSQQSPSAGIGGIYGTTGGGVQPGGPQAPYQVQQYVPTNQYGSRASLNSQYAALPNVGGGQYAGQGPYGVVSQQPQPLTVAAGSPVVVNPYGTPVNSVNQAYAHGAAQPDANAYAPVGSVQPANVAAAPPPPPGN